MSIKLYMDVQVPAGITSRLTARNVDVITAQEDGADELPDSDLLDRATGLERAIFTQDKDFHRITTLRLRAGVPFYCVFFAVQDPERIILYLEWLEIHAKLSEPDEVRNRLIFIP